MMRFCISLLPLLAAVLAFGGCGAPAEGEALFTRFSYSGCDARFDRALDPQNEYFNPVLAGFHPDPSVCRRGGGPFATLAAGIDTRNLSTHTARGFNGVIVGLHTGRLPAGALASGE